MSTKRITYLVCAHVLATSLFLFSMTLTVEAQGPLQNPLNSKTVPEFIAGALKALALIALPIITLFLVISGFLFVSARGNAQQLETAKKNFFYVIIGAVLILGAWILATLIAGTVNQIAGK